MIITTYQVELVWDREFHFVANGPEHNDIDSAIKHARAMEDSGDGSRVKKTRVVDSEGKVVWQYGKKVVNQ